MNCPECGFANTPDARFCRQCGHALSAPQMETTVDSTCSQCGSLNKPGAKFCRSCGSDLTARATQAQAPPSEEAAPSTPPAIDSITDTPVETIKPAIEDTAVAEPEFSQTGTAEFASVDIRKPAAPFSVVAIVLAVSAIAGVGGYFWWESSAPPKAIPAAPLPPVAAEVQPAPEPSPASVPAEPEPAPAVEPSPAPAPVASSTPQHVAKPSTPPTENHTAKTEPPSKTEGSTRTASPKPSTQPASKPTPVPVEAGAAPTSLAEAMKIKCAGKTNFFEHKFCEEKVRWSYCSGKWGKTPDCPQGQYDDQSGI